MSGEIRVVKSPLPYGIEDLPEFTPMGFVTTNITLESGIVITNPEQFPDEEAIEDYEPEDSSVAP